MNSPARWADEVNRLMRERDEILVGITLAVGGRPIVTLYPEWIHQEHPKPPPQDDQPELHYWRHDLMREGDEAQPLEHWANLYTHWELADTTWRKVE